MLKPVFRFVVWDPDVVIEEVKILMRLGLTVLNDVDSVLQTLALQLDLLDQKASKSWWQTLHLVFYLKQKINAY